MIRTEPFSARFFRHWSTWTNAAVETVSPSGNDVLVVPPSYTRTIEPPTPERWAGKDAPQTLERIKETWR